MVIVNDNQTEKLVKEVIFLYKIHFLLNNLKNYNLKEKKSINESDKKKDQNKLIKYFEQLKEIYSSDDIDNSNIILKIKTLNGFETNDFIMLRLYGLEGKSKQIKLINNKKQLDEFEFKCHYIGQLIGLSIRIDDGNYLYKCV